MRLRFPALALFLLLPVLFAQHRKVDMRNTHYRLICVVPIIGKGTPADPFRPEYAPLPSAAPAAAGIIAYTWQPTDDKKRALVEFVARDRAAFKAILEDRRPGVKVFEKGKAKRADILGEFRKLKKDIDLDAFGVNVP